MKLVTVEIWVPEDHAIETGHNGAIAPDVLGILSQYSAHVLSDEAIAKRAENIGYQAYRQTVRDIVANMLDEIKSGEIESEDAANDWLHQTVDGHHDVIYTACAKDVLRYSENEDALQDEYGSDELVRDGNLNWSGMAYAALLADVNAEIAENGGLAQYFECRECSYAVPTGMGETDWTRNDEGLPICADCREAIAKR